MGLKEFIAFHLMSNDDEDCPLNTEDMNIIIKNQEQSEYRHSVYRDFTIEIEYKKVAK